MMIVVSVLNGSVDAAGWVDFLIALGLLLLNLWAVSRIISQAGYSRTWILVPLAPFVLTIISFAILAHDVDQAFAGGTVGLGGINTVGVVWRLDWLSAFANWIFFLVFAFSRWPVATGRVVASADGTATQAAALAAAAATSPTSRAARPGKRRGTSNKESDVEVVPTLPPPPVIKAPRGNNCPWCGEALPGNRAMFHDCGPKDRPAFFCRQCGSSLAEGSAECTSCGAES